MKNNKFRLKVPEGINELSASEYNALAEPEQPERRNKHGNIKVLLSDGTKVDSKAEARRYNELILMKQAGIIKDFKRQVKYKLLDPVPKLFLEKKYIADFVVEYPDGSIEIEDVKSVHTRKDKYFRLKKHLFYKIYNIVIKEIIYEKSKRNNNKY